MSKVRIKQIRSGIDRSIKQKRTLKALGLNKINGTVEHELNDTMRGMIFKVSHLVEVVEIDSVKTESGSRKSGATAAAESAKVTVASSAAKTVVSEEEE